MSTSNSFVATVAVVALLFVTPAAGAGGMMRRETHENQNAGLAASQSRLQAALGDVVGNAPAKQLFAVEASIRRTFEAFPKNSVGKIPGKEIFSSIVRDYFAKDHGWLITGMEPPMMRPKVTETYEALILQEKAPELTGALSEAQKSELGVSLSDVVATVAAIEALILEESIPLLRTAYGLNGHPNLDQVNTSTVHEVLRSYLLLFRQGESSKSLADVGKHAKKKASAQEDDEGWRSLVSFEQDVLASSGQTAPYTFQAAEQVVKDMARGYGRWQNSECLEMKATLMALDSDGLGSVPLSTFQAVPNHTAFTFSESADYLRKVGALDETVVSEEVGGEPRVRIANYLLTPSNCIASSRYYSVCCLSECEGIIDVIEGIARKPAMNPDELLEVLSKVPSSTVQIPREIPGKLGEELRRASAHHGGAIPLHSSDFKRWLHSAFPNECPYPTATENAAEDSEEASAEAWLALQAQQKSTRIPAWMTVGEEITV